MRRILATLVVALGLSASHAIADTVADHAQARSYIVAENWPAAAAAYRAIVTTDPNQGADWYFWGVSLSRLGNCAEALPALERALALGVNGERSGLRRAEVEAAGCAAALGNADGALAHLSIAQARYGFASFSRLAQDPRYAGLALDPRFRRLAGSDGAGMERVAGWQADLDYYIDLLERRHPNPFHSAAEAEWRQTAAALREQIPGMSDAQIIGGFMHLASLIGDGHTNVIPPLEGPRAFHLLPIWPYAFGDEWYVMAAAPGHADLVGARIIALNGRPMGEVVASMRTMLSPDNDMSFLWFGSVALQFSEFVALAAPYAGATETSLDIEDANGARRSVRLTAGPIDRDPTGRWAPADWPSMAARTAPAWLARSNEPYWFERRGDLVYAQINQIADGEGGQTFAEFVTALGREMGRARRVVLDLRHNNGGSGVMNWSLVREIVRAPQIDQEGRLFVIVGRRTFSAAMNLASMLETHTDAIFVGEPTGSRPNFYGEDTPFTLPHSRLTGSISSAWFQGGATSDDSRPWIAPSLPAPLTPDDALAGHDPAMAAIEAYRSPSR